MVSILLHYTSTLHLYLPKVPLRAILKSIPPPPVRDDTSVGVSEPNVAPIVVVVVVVVVVVEC